ncbi:MAG: hypothetical protein AAF413_02305 [Patescibacteria group bacterium]
MTYATAANASRNSYRVNKNSVKYTSRTRGIGAKTNMAILVLLGCLLAATYLTQVTKTSAYSYGLRNLEDQKVSLEKDFASLEVEQAKLESVETIRQSSVAKNLTEPTSISVLN